MTRTRCSKCGGLVQLVGVVTVATPDKGLYVQYKCSKCNAFFTSFLKQKDENAKEQKAS